MGDSSILAGVDNLIDKALGLEDERYRYRVKKRCQLFSKGAKPDFDGKELIQTILNQVKSNWHKGKSRSNNQNWRWKKNPNVAPKSKDGEVVLERWIVRTTGDDWVNQVPVASGVTASAGGRRAIDLVHRCPNGWYEFIELKVNERGGTPLFAAMEILQYGVLYIFSREKEELLGYRDADRGLLGAIGIHLKVLAPATYYEPYDLSWLEKSINRGLANFLAQGERGFKMDFKFESLSLIPSCSGVTWKVQA
jgi:hypothetical protein